MALILLAAWAGLTACAGHRGTHPADTGISRQSLDLWLDRTLIPYLIQQFDQHPRFRSQPVLLVRMQGENVLPHIDELTGRIRRKITDALLAQPGLELAWRPSMQSGQYHPSLDDIACGKYNDVNYYVGIDCGLTRTGRRLYVKVRALNLAENKWVSGFGKSWQGIPTAEQIGALERVQVDEYVRGQRPLPFSSHQPDLLAAYLARNLSCVLQRGSADSLVVYVSRPDLKSSEIFKTALDIVGRYLARFKEVEVTDDPSRANVTLVAAIHAIDRRLHQVWISARRHPEGTYLPGAGAEAYVTLDSPAVKPFETARTGLHTVSASRLRPDRDDTGTFPIISSFDLLIPPDQRRCTDNSAWRSGLKRADPDQLLITGDCVALDVQTSVPAYIFLMGQDAAGELSRVYPGDCFAPGKPVARLHPGGHFRFPAPLGSHPGVLRIGGPPGIERIYAVAITAPGLASRFDGRMGDIQGLCQPGSGFPNLLRFGGLRDAHERVERWQNYLTWLSNNHPGLMDWHEIRFRHAEM